MKFFIASSTSGEVSGGLEVVGMFVIDGMVILLHTTNKSKAM
jgi:hypothetical protein